MKLLLLALILVGIACGYPQLNAQQNMQDNVETRQNGECRDDPSLSAVACKSFKNQRLCQYAFVHSRCCETCTEEEGKRKLSDENLLELLSRYLAEEKGEK